MAVAAVAAAVVVVAILYGIAGRGSFRAEDLLAVYREEAQYDNIAIAYPLDETLFPPEMVPPTFRWKDSVAGAKAWLIRVDFDDDGPCMLFAARRSRWTPGPEDWETIKQRSLERDARVLILGAGRGRSARVVSRAKMSFRTSRDPVEARVDAELLRRMSLELPELDVDPALVAIVQRRDVDHERGMIA